MKQKIAKDFFRLVFAAGLLAGLSVAAPALAATPTLSITPSSDNNYVQINVTGDPNAGVIMFYSKTNVGQQAVILGTTNASGSLSLNASITTYQVVPGSSVYVTTGGYSGPQSPQVAWPSVAAASNFSLSQTGIALSVGQTSAITAYNNLSSSIYLSANSNPSVANLNISGNQITVTALSYGSTMATLCAQGGSTTGCASVYVTVQNSNTQALNFSINNVTVAPGTNLPITITGGNGSYTILNNSNASIIQATVSGATITLSTTKTSGSASITVCSSDISSCGVITATAGTSSYVPLSFNQSSPSISVGQTLTIAVSGGSSGSYYISGNTNPTAVLAFANGSGISVSGVTAGSATVTVCATGGSCATLAVTVLGSGTNTPIVLGQNNLNLTAGAATTVAISGSGGYAISGNTNPNIATVQINGNSAAVTAVAAGSTTVSICQSGGQCAILFVNVNGNGTQMGQLYFSTIAPPVGMVDQSYAYQLAATGGNGAYSFRLASGTLPSGLTLGATGLLSGTPTVSGTNTFSVTVSDTAGSVANSAVSVSVNPTTTPATTTPPTTTPLPTAGSYSNGKLILENGTIYIVFQNTKVGFTNAKAFLGLGFRFSDVTPVTNSGLLVSPKVVITAAGAHPRGTWIASGKVVYLVTPDGLIPVPDWDTFLNNGGAANLIVKANRFDLALAKLSPMSANDARTRQ